MRKILISILAVTSILGACGKKNNDVKTKQLGNSYDSLPAAHIAIDELKGTKWKSKNTSSEIILKIEPSGDTLNFEKNDVLSSIINCTYGKFKIVPLDNHYALTPTECGIIAGGKRYDAPMAYVKLVNKKVTIFKASSSHSNSEGTKLNNFIEFERIE